MKAGISTLVLSNPKEKRTSTYNDLPRVLEDLASIGYRSVGILVDTGHCICYLRQDPAQVIREIGNRLWSLHIHDNHGSRDEHLIPGEGVIEWKGVLKALKDIGYRGVFMMECYNSHSTRGSKNIAQLAKIAAERLLGEAN
jgi:sugar phosphate isomerase/epimerase